MKNKRISFFALILLIFSVAMMSIAYLTSPTEELNNVFTIGKIDPPTIDEPNFPEDPPPLIPGTLIPKDPTITLGENTVESYVYIAVKSKLVYMDEGDLVDATTYYHGSTFTTPAPGDIVDVGTVGFDPAWNLLTTEVDATNKFIMYIFRFNTALETSGAELAVEPIVFSAVGFDDALTAEQIDLIEMVSGAQSIDIKGFVHQTVDSMAVGDIDNIVIDFFLDSANWD